MSLQFERKLGLWSAIALVVGSIIGSSIFMKPATMAAQLGDPFLLLLVWLVAGGISLIGASINAEIGSMIPETGGQYIYFKKMYGDKFAFMYGWASFSVINTASVAAIAYVFALYFNYVMPLPKFSSEVEHQFLLTIPYVGKFYLLENFGVKLLSIFAVVLLTFYNHLGVALGGKIQLWMTWIKVVMLVAMCIVIFLFGKGSTENFIYYHVPLIIENNWQKLLAFTAALSGAFAAYDGWNNLGFVAGEIKNPSKVIPKALIFGIGICVSLYLITNMAYLYMMPIENMQSSVLVAKDALLPITGIVGGSLISIMVAVSTLGATNGNIMACSRVTFSMAEENQFFASIGKVHPKYKSPSNALWLHCVWTCLFILSGSFDMLTDMYIFATWIFYGFAAYGIFILRKKMPDLERPYKAFGYPFLPILFVLFTFAYTVLTIYNDVVNYQSGKTEVINSIFAIIILSSGFLVLWARKYRV